jgi:hypothetical protein
MLQENKYSIQLCKVHKITIHYLKRESEAAQETQCWDCIKEANDKKFKREATARRAKEQFVEEFAHLLKINCEGGIVSVQIEKTNFNVVIETSQIACNSLPEEYQGFTINKQITGV